MTQPAAYQTLDRAALLHPAWRTTAGTADFQDTVVGTEGGRGLDEGGGLAQEAGAGQSGRSAGRHPVVSRSKSRPAVFCALWCI